MYYINLFITSVFIENIALTLFLGMCTFLAMSKRVDTALGLGVAVVVVMGITTPLNTYINTLLAPDVLIQGLDLSFLSLLVNIGVIAACVQILEMFLDRYVPSLYNTLGVFLPLITVNCAILAGTLFSESRGYDVLEATFFGLGAGVGWSFALVLLAGIREKLKYSHPPAAVQGMGLIFFTTGLMAFAFMAFNGIKLG